MADPADKSESHPEELSESALPPDSEGDGAPPDGETAGAAPAFLTLIIWLCGFFLLLVFLIWDSLVDVIRWLLS